MAPVDIRPIRAEAERLFPADDPIRVQMTSLPDRVSNETYAVLARGWLAIIAERSRSREGR